MKRGQSLSLLVLLIILIIVFIIAVYTYLCKNRAGLLVDQINKYNVLFRYNSSDFESKNLGNWKVDRNIYNKDVKWSSDIKTAAEFRNKNKKEATYNCNGSGVLLSDKIYKHKWCEKYDISSNPVIFMSYNINHNLLDAITPLESFCIKPSHMSDSQGVLLVKNWTLIKSMGIDFYKKCPKWLKKYKKGYKITPLEIYDIMKEMRKVDWENNHPDMKHCHIPTGVVVEELINNVEEIKIFVGMGKPLGYFWQNDIFTGAFTEKDIEIACDLAQRVAVASGLLLTRVDCMKSNKGIVFVNEISNSINYSSKSMLFDPYYPYITKYMMNVQ